MFFKGLLLCFAGAAINTYTTAQCDNKYPEYELPDSLEFRPSAFWSEYDSHFRDYVVKEGVKQFTMNCTSIYPIIWRVTLTKAYTNVKVDLYSKSTEIIIMSNKKEYGHCYKASITFLEVNQNLSGLYTCESIFYRQEIRFRGIYIYGRNGSFTTGVMLNRGENYAIKQENSFGLLQNNSVLFLPCFFNKPSILLTNISFPKEGEKSFSVSAKVCSDARNLCLDFKSVPPTLNSRSLFKHGAKISCSSNASMSESDVVELNILPADDFEYDPIEEEMKLEVNWGEEYIFWCQSTNPIKFTTDYAYEYHLVTNSSTHSSYPYYQAKLHIIMPNEDLTLEWKDDNRRSFSEIKLNASCREEQERANGSTKAIIWKYSLILSSYSLDEYQPAKMIDHNAIEIVELKNFPYQTVVCRTAFPRTLKVYWVQCSTITECQMKAPLLSNDDNLWEEDYLTRHTSRVEFVLDSGISGMVRCVGFQKDIMSFFYVGLELEPGSFRPHYRLPHSTNFNSRVRNPLIELNTSQIMVGESILAKCSSSLMPLISASILEFYFRNGTSGFIYKHYILEYNSTTANETNVIFVILRIPSTEIIGITCSNIQYDYVSPLFWSKGVLLKNAEDYTHKLKIEKKHLNVTSLPVESSVTTSPTGMYIATAFGVLFLIGIFTSLFFYRRYQHQKKLLEQISDEEIARFINGIPELISENETSNVNAQYLPFSPKFNISPENLEIDYREKLGEGEFGIVYKGLLKLGTDVTVAVKTLKPNCSPFQVKSAMIELKVMIFIGDHDNIVQIFGACINDLRNNKLHVVMQFCENSSLLNYLRKNSSAFFNQVARGVYDSNLQDPGNYVHFVATSDLIRWAHQIANGMKYISEHNVIHGDLAARNILLDENLTAKISDFGLSRKLYQYPAYKRSLEVQIPWCWCALESLLQQEYSLASDIWSFGITLWEIFSLGEVPYPGLTYGRHFILMLTKGFRMAMPEYASCEIYNIMMECWQKEPSRRPRFGELKERLQEMFSTKQSIGTDVNKLEDVNDAVTFTGKPTRLPSHYSTFSELEMM